MTKGHNVFTLRLYSSAYTYLQATLKDLQTTLKVAKSKEAASLPKEAKQTATPVSLDLESGVDADEHQALMQQQQQQQERLVLESRLQYNDALIDERDEGIQDIQRNIQDIQEMFQVYQMTPCAADNHALPLTSDISNVQHSGPPCCASVLLHASCSVLAAVRSAGTAAVLPVVLTSCLQLKCCLVALFGLPKPQVSYANLVTLLHYILSWSQFLTWSQGDTHPQLCMPIRGCTREVANLTRCHRLNLHWVHILMPTWQYH